jgi:hypothetical protein
MTQGYLDFEDIRAAIRRVERTKRAAEHTARALARSQQALERSLSVLSLEEPPQH